MADIMVDTYSMKQYAKRLGDVVTRISNLDGRIRSLYSRVGLVGLYNLLQSDSLDGYNWRLRRAQDYLEQTSLDFENLENLIGKMDPTDFIRPEDAFGFILTNPLPQTKWWQDFCDFQRGLRNTDLGVILGSAATAFSDSGWAKFFNGELEESFDFSFWNTGKEREDSSVLHLLYAGLESSIKPELGKYESDDVKEIIKQKPLGDKSKDDDTEWYDKKGTIFEVNAESQARVSVLNAQLSGESEYAQGSVESNILTAEAHASASGGFYVYEKDKDGNVKRIFSPGVSAEVGASVSVVQVEAEGRVGLGEDNNMLGVYGKADARALTAEANAKFALNKDEVYLGASAEADLVKISGTTGVSVLGTDIGVSGSLKVGVGAHANVGFEDGKLKVDVGAAIGVGFDIGFEVDVGGTVDAICDGAKKAWDWLF